MGVPTRARFVAQVAASALTLAACAAITGVDDLVENGGEPDARPIDAPLRRGIRRRDAQYDDAVDRRWRASHA